MNELQIGDKAPAFSRLTALKGTTLVVFFYPKDNTSGCTVEACELRDAHPKLTKKKAGRSRGQSRLDEVTREVCGEVFPTL